MVDGVGCRLAVDRESVGVGVGLCDGIDWGDAALVHCTRRHYERYRRHQSYNFDKWCRCCMGGVLALSRYHHDDVLMRKSC